MHPLLVASSGVVPRNQAVRAAGVVEDGASAVDSAASAAGPGAEASRSM